MKILVVNDNSSDGTEPALRDLAQRYPSVRYVNNLPPNGFGFAVRRGIEAFTGDAVAIYMADASERARDLIRFYRKMLEGYDWCSAHAGAVAAKCMTTRCRSATDRMANCSFRVLCRTGTTTRPTP